MTPRPSPTLSHASIVTVSIGAPNGRMHGTLAPGSFK
jgi:hypothetical protein